jgi:hypothetical protein
MCLFSLSLFRFARFASWAWTFFKRSFSGDRADRDLAMRRLTYASHGLFLSMIEEENLAVPVAQGRLGSTWCCCSEHLCCLLVFVVLKS